jgi:type II secretory pathway pseudopilin PulG
MNIKNRKGFTLIELWFSILVSCFVFTTYMYTHKKINSKQDAKYMAEQMSVLGEATQRYLIANRSILLEKTAGGTTVSVYLDKDSYTASNNSTTYPDVINNLQYGGYLSPAFINNNAYGQKTYLLVKQDKYNRGNLTGLLVTSGGRNISDTQLGRILMNMGDSGGIIFSNSKYANSSQIYGYSGSWISNISDWNGIVKPSVGHIVYRVDMMTGNGLNPDDFLSKSVIGNGQISEAGTKIHTDMDMNGNNITGVNNTQTNFIESSNSNNIYVADHANGIGSQQKTGLLISGNVVTGANGTLQTKNLPSFNNGLLIWDIYAENSVTTSNAGHLTTYLNGWNGSIQASNYISSSVIRPDYVAVEDTACLGQGISGTSFFGKTVTSNYTVKLGDLARNSNGLPLSCQKKDDGSYAWEPFFKAYTHMVNTSCPSQGNGIYTNNSGVPEYISVITNYSGSGDTSTQSLILQVKDANTSNWDTIWYQQEDARKVHIVATGTLRQSKQFSGYAFLAPGKQLNINASNGVQKMCIFE